MAEIFFEKFNVPAAFFSLQAVLALYVYYVLVDDFLLILILVSEDTRAARRLVLHSTVVMVLVMRFRYMTVLV